jgi:hypothetical protein
MKKVLATCLGVIAVCLASSSTALASSSPLLQLQILPPTCSIDTLQSGVNVITQISPNCTIQQLNEEARRTVRPSHLAPRQQFLFKPPADTGYKSIRPVTPTPGNDHVKTPAYPYDTAIPVLAIALIVASVIVILASQTSAGAALLQRIFKGKSVR